MMSHELRTPLNAIVGFSEVLADQKFGEMNDRQARFNSNVLDSGRHLLRLINDLLDLSKVEAGHLEVTRQRCSVRSIAVDVVATLQHLADERHIEVVIDDAAPPLVVADPVRVKQILYNYLSNALKFSPEHGRVDVVFSHSADSVRVSVRDAGPGVAPAERERLFKPFSRLSRAQVTGSSLGGTGLGLALARQLADLMRGQVGVDSEPSAGAAFWLELPRDASGKQVTSSTEQTAAPSAPMALVVDDDPAARELVELALQGAGYRTTAASTGEEALSAARRIRPQFITLDVFLPGIDGWDVLRVLRTDSVTRGIPVVMLTISTDRNKAMTLGAVEHLVKPIDQAALAKVIPIAPRLPMRQATSVLLIGEGEQIAELKGDLTTRGFDVHTADQAGRGLAIIRDDARIDLVLLDSVSDMEPLEVVERLRADPRTREVPVVLLAQSLGVAERARFGCLVQAVLDRSVLQPDEVVREVSGVVAQLTRSARG